MIAVNSFNQPMLSYQAARRALIDSPDWKWGYKLIGDPLLRADEHLVHGFGGQSNGLSRLVASIQDPKARTEIRNRAERKLRDLERQLADLRSRHFPELEREAEAELNLQRNFVQLIAQETE